MNTRNNRRRRESVRRLEDAFLQLLKEQELEHISVSQLCKTCGLNRSTFYANYTDIYDLAEQVRLRLEAEVDQLYRSEQEMGYNSNDFLKLFRHIQDNQLLYRTYFKLGYAEQFRTAPLRYNTHLAQQFFGNQHMDYHIEFFRSGFNAIVKMWLLGGCRETPEEMAHILSSEYQHCMP